jgi:hypothetical protein
VSCNDAVDHSKESSSSNNKRVHNRGRGRGCSENHGGGNTSGRGGENVGGHGGGNTSCGGGCDRTTSEMRGLSPKIISGDSRRSENAQTHTHKHTIPNMKFNLKLL